MDQEPAPVASVIPAEKSATNGHKKAKKHKSVSKPRSEGGRPFRSLPTNRIAFAKQLDILRAYAAASGQAGKTVRLSEVADIVKMRADTVTMANAFFTEVGFIHRVDSAFLPASEVVGYQQAYQWNPDTAATKLAPLITESWFGKALMPGLNFGGIEEKEAVEKLALASKATPEYRSQVSLLLEYMEIAGVIIKDGSVVRLNTRGSNVSVAMPDEGKGPTTSPEPRDLPLRSPGLATTFAQAGVGAVQFQVSFKVDMAEMAGWGPERISAFFAGIAQVLAAKGSIEKEAAKH